MSKTRHRATGIIVRGEEGEPKLSPELIKMGTPDNTYQLVWLPMLELKDIDIAEPRQQFEELNIEFDEGFSLSEKRKISSTHTLS